MEEKATEMNKTANRNFYFLTPIVDLKATEFLSLFRKWTKNRSITKKRFRNMKSLLNSIYQYAIEQKIVQHNPTLEMNCPNCLLNQQTILVMSLL